MEDGRLSIAAVSGNMLGGWVEVVRLIVGAFLDNSRIRQSDAARLSPDVARLCWATEMGKRRGAAMGQ